jgi:hypothetical protein
MMMQMLTETDNNLLHLLEGYKQSNTSTYNLYGVWNEDNTFTLRHAGNGFFGPTQAYKQFIGTEVKYGQSIILAFSAGSPTIPTIDQTKKYRLTFTVKNVEYNTATDETTDTLEISIGLRSKYYTQITSIKDITVGTKIVVEMTDATGLGGAVYGSTVGSALWSFDFDVKLEEV